MKYLLVLLVCLLAVALGQTISDKVFFDITIGGKAAGRVVLGLYENTPKTSTNFLEIANGFTGKDGKFLTYKNNVFHRIIPNFMIQGGDIVSQNGMGSASIYGSRFADENFLNKHSKPFLLSMANAGPGTNGSQFFITTVPTPWLDNKHVVFGEVLEGKDVVKKIEAEGTGSGAPKSKVVIVDCGVLPK